MVKLTQYSKSSGCGCKIAPSVLEQILKGTIPQLPNSNLLVGYNTNDDAAIYNIDGNECVISTTDFFMPIVDDAFDFGRVAACNAINDVYAMGGRPIMAIAILGWPVDKLPLEEAQNVLNGAKKQCEVARIPLAGGHSIDSLEPIFGLSVTGLVKKEHIKRNNTAQEGDAIYLTKPLGTGVLSTALKRGALKQDHYSALIEAMTTLNSEGEWLGTLPYVTAMTDVTGFGLIGHLTEMLHGTNCTAVITKQNIPVFASVLEYSSQFIFPDNTTRNYNTYQSNVSGLVDLDFITYCDPQTAGGLLFTVKEEYSSEFELLLKEKAIICKKIGEIQKKGGTSIQLV